MKPNKEGKDIILRHYDIISITSFSIAIDYLLNNVKLTQGVYSSSCGQWHAYGVLASVLRQSYHGIAVLFQRRSAVN